LTKIILCGPGSLTIIFTNEDLHRFKEPGTLQPKKLKTDPSCPKLTTPNSFENNAFLTMERSPKARKELLN
jgi:hypothetical protein